MIKVDHEQVEGPSAAATMSVTTNPNSGAKAEPKRKRFNALAELKKGDLISKADAAKHIAQRTGRIHDLPETAKDRARKQIGNITQESFIRCGRLLVSGHLAFWAQQKWPGQFDDWAAYASDCVNISVRVKTTLSHPVPQFQSIDECRNYIAKLTASLEECRLELSRCSDDAAKHQAAQKCASDFGREGGRGNVSDEKRTPK